MGNYYEFLRLKDLNYSKYELGEITNAREYNSDNTTQLDVEGMKLLLKKLKFIQAASRGEVIDPEE